MTAGMTRGSWKSGGCIKKAGLMKSLPVTAAPGGRHKYGKLKNKEREESC